MTPSPDRGATWGIWDLHVHTPASHEHGYGDRNDEAVWERYIKELEGLPPDVRVLGVNDYLHIRGYEKLREAKEQGRLPKIDLLLPMVELRIDRFAGQGKFRRVNYHVVFSDELNARQIRRLFVDRLTLDLDFGGGNTYQGGASTDEELEELGRVYKESLPSEKRGGVSDIDAGFLSATYAFDEVRRLLDTNTFKGKVLQGLGLNEWKDLRWDGAGGPQKKDIACRSDFILVASPTPDDAVEHRAQLVADNIKTPLLHASDAHYLSNANVSNRIGTAWGWLKAAPSFDGLRHAIQRPDERIYIGERPPKQKVIAANRTKFLSRVRVAKVEGAALDEKWFNVDIPVNGDLVALIGNQGEGKSALVDSIALAANARTQHFSFLNERKFCHPKDNKAASFNVTLEWADGTEIEKNLAGRPDLDAVERLRYVPQSFFDEATNETEVAEGGFFYAEVKRAVFSHVSEDDRLGCESFDALVSAKSASAVEAGDQLKGELTELNRRIAIAERTLKPECIKGLHSKLAQKEAEIESLRRSPPEAVPPPPEDAARDKEMADALEAESAVRDRYEQLRAEMSALKRRSHDLEALIKSLMTLKREVSGTLSVANHKLTDLGIDPRTVVNFNLDETPVLSALGETEAELSKMEDRRAAVEDEQKEVTAVRERLTKAMEGAAKAFAEYEQRVAEWKAVLKAMVGAPDVPDTLEYLKEEIRRVEEDLPGQLEQLYIDRWELFRSIHSEAVREADVYRELTEPVRAFVEADPLLSGKYSLGVELTVSAERLSKGLFRFIGKRRGSFRGSELGPALALQIACRHEPVTPEGAEALVEDVLDHLNRNHNYTPPTAEDIDDALTNDAAREDLYNYLFGLEYLAPQYELTLAGQPLSRLSPGERGVLLLVFYLVVDRGNEPLIIDQPEGNLNNQSIFENLVPIFKAAKARRQIIIVTHNPNLAVVCDAEQVIVARRHRTDGNRLEYASGALEDVAFRQQCLELLEGTADAFGARQSAYFDLL